jgi:uncharacterized protein
LLRQGGGGKAGTGQMARSVRIAVGQGGTVSGLLEAPDGARACLVLAHGAGAGMSHPFMAAVADGLSARRVASLRYQFPYMEAGSKRPDRPAVAMHCVRAAVAAAAEFAPGLALFGGGKSFGGRMTSMAAADGGLASVRGLVFLGFPLHLAGKPSDARAAHLEDVALPMLFVSGTSDALADMTLLRSVVARLGNRARLLEVEGADHSLHVPVRSGRTDAAVLVQVLDDVVAWLTCTNGHS